MKSAGYDIVILINERFLNQLSGALFYSGFLTLNGSVDFFDGKIKMKKQSKNIDLKLPFSLQEKLPVEMDQFLNLDFRFKLTREPMIDFYNDIKTKEQGLRFSIGFRSYFFLWQGIEIKFDADLTATSAIEMDEKLNLIVDFAKIKIEDLSVKYSNSMKTEIKKQLNTIIEKAIMLYFEDSKIEKKLYLPCISNVLPEVNQYIQPVDESIGILPMSIDAIKVVSPTTLAIAINLMNYTGGDYNALHDFAKNSSVSIAVAETTMFKVYDYAWKNSKFVKSFGNDGSIVLVKDYDNLTVAKTGSFRVAKLDKFFRKVSTIAEYVEKLVSKGLTMGILETSVKYEKMEFDYGMRVNLKTQPKFDLLGGNLVSIYNMSLDVLLHLSCYCTIKYEVEIDTSGWIPDSWTPWDDDITVYEKTKTYKLFDMGINMNNLKLRYGEGKLNWNENKQALELEITKVNLYWDFMNTDCPLLGLPETLINWIIDQFEDDIVKKLPKITITPSMKLDIPMVQWPMKMEGKKLEITNSEAVVAIKGAFEVLERDLNPVPKYIVNENNKEIHKIGCDCINDIYEEHQRGYYLLNDALNLDNDGCNECLPAFHKK